MSLHAKNLLKVANDLSKIDPILAHELQDNLRSFISVMNPGAESFVKKIQKSQQILRHIQDNANLALSQYKKLGGPKANLSDLSEVLGKPVEELDPEVEILKNYLHDVRRKSASSRVALFGKIKDWFSPKKKVVEEDPELDEEESSSRNEEYKQTVQYWQNVDGINQLYDALVKNPTVRGLKILLDEIKNTLPLGDSLLKGKVPESPEEQKKTLNKYFANLLRTEYGSDNYNANLRELYNYLKNRFKTASVSNLDDQLVVAARIASATRGNVRVRKDVMKVFDLAC